MKHLLKSVLIIDSTSDFHQQKKDILIEDGQITQLEDLLSVEDAEIIQGEGLLVTKGWVDVKSRLCDPGEEHKETIETGLDAAAFGGFTHVCSVPNTHPITDSKLQIEYQINRANNHIVQLHPIGALTTGMEGKDMAEYYDMQQSGAVAFCDDEKSVSPDILYRALLYSKSFGAQLMVSSLEPTISKHGIVNEGFVSAKTGFKPSPAVAEWIEINRNIEIANYTGGKLHLTGVSTEESVELIRQAKKKGISITADVQIEHLLFNENENLNFDTHYRFYPVLRREEDRKALWEGLKDGTIDFIAANHRPCDIEEKNVVFEDAACGVIRYQTVMNELSMAPEFDLLLILEILSNRNRQFIQNKANTKIKIGTTADLTVYSPNKSWEFDASTLLSKSSNSYLFGKELRGEAVAIFHQGKVCLKKVD